MHLWTAGQHDGDVWHFLTVVLSAIINHRDAVGDVVGQCVIFVVVENIQTRIAAWRHQIFHETPHFLEICCVPLKKFAVESWQDMSGELLFRGFILRMATQFNEWEVSFIHCDTCVATLGVPHHISYPISEKQTTALQFDGVRRDYLGFHPMTNHISATSYC